MIMVDVYVPSLDKTWDLKIDENAEVSRVTEKLAELISDELGETGVCGNSGFTLYSVDNEMSLPLSSTMSSCGIKNGYKLLLV